MNQESAQELIEKALQNESQSIAYLLIDTAYRLDNSIDCKSIKRKWTDQWMKREYQKMIDQQTATPQPKPCKH